jgi:TctA family transporter
MKSLNKIMLLAVLFSIPVMLSSCSNTGGLSHGTGTQVDLGKKNYRVVKSNATGTSWGFWLLGFIPIIPTSQTEAITHMCEKSSLTEGAAQAYINVAEEKSTIYLILFSLPKISVRADIVEFTD